MVVGAFMVLICAQYLTIHHSLTYNLRAKAPPMPVIIQKPATPVFVFDRRFYGWSAVSVALIALVGFARTYYLKGFFGTPTLPPFVHFHGLVMSAWVALFFVQTRLIAAHRVALHRALGIVGCGLAVLVVLVAADATMQAAGREVAAHRVGPFHFLLGINFINLFVFAVLFAAAIVWRKRSDFHKRLMLLATVNLLAPAAARICLNFTHNQYVQLAAFFLCILLCVAVDTVRHRRLHPAMGWGAALSIVMFSLIFIAVQWPAWVPFVDNIMAP
jgi:hypothetical protein